jgi:hypothetical protein
MNYPTLLAAVAMAGALSGAGNMYRGHAGGRISEQFDLGSIMKARRNNQRAKEE